MGGGFDTAGPAPGTGRLLLARVACSNSVDDGVYEGLVTTGLAGALRAPRRALHLYSNQPRIELPRIEQQPAQVRVDRSRLRSREVSLGVGCSAQTLQNSHQHCFDARFIPLQKWDEIGLSQKRRSEGCAECHEEIESGGKGGGRGAGVAVDDALFASQVSVLLVAVTPWPWHGGKR